MILTALSLLVASTAQAVPLTFQFDVSQRQTLLVDAASGRYSWQTDSTFAGQSFQLTVDLDPLIIQTYGPRVSGNETFAHTEFTTVHFSGTPFDQELAAVNPYDDVRDQDSAWATEWYQNGSGRTQARFVSDRRHVETTVAGGLVDSSMFLQLLDFSAFVYGSPTSADDVGFFDGSSYLSLLNYIADNRIRFNFSLFGRVLDWWYPVGDVSSLTYTGGSGIGYTGTAQLLATPVPEPRSLFLVLTGLITIVLCRAGHRRGNCNFGHK